MSAIRQATRVDLSYFLHARSSFLLYKDVLVVQESNKACPDTNYLSGKLFGWREWSIYVSTLLLSRAG